MRLHVVAALATFLPMLALDGARADEFMERVGASGMGILSYCQAKGFADADAVTAARAEIARELEGDVERERREGITRPHIDPALAKSLEASGRAGMFVNPDDGQLIPLADYARLHGMSERDHCHQLMTRMAGADRIAR